MDFDSDNGSLSEIAEYIERLERQKNQKKDKEADDSASTHSSEYEQEWLEEYKADCVHAVSLLKDDTQSDNELLRDAKEANENLSKMKTKITVQEKKENKPACWGDYETLRLIDEYDKLRNKSNPKLIWTEIAKNLKSKNLEFTPKQIKRRFHFLLNKYKETKDHNNTTGKSPATCPYYELFDEMFTKEHNITPQYASSSINPLQKNIEKSEDNEGSEIQKVNKADIIDKDKVHDRIAEKRKATEQAGHSKESKKKKKNSEKEEFMEFLKKRDEMYINVMKDQGNRMADEVKSIGDILRNISKK